MFFYKFLELIRWIHGGKGMKISTYIFFVKKSQNICHLSKNAYICRRKETTNDNVYSKYMLVVALFTTHTVARNAAPMSC